MPYVIADACIDVKDKSCLPACPVDCIYVDDDWKPAPDDWWQHAGNPGDPYR